MVPLTPVSQPTLFPQLAGLPGKTGDPFALNLQAGLMVAGAVAAAVHIRLPDAFADEALPVTLLAQETQTHAPSLLLLLRALTRIGIFVEVDEQRHMFAHTERSRALMRNAPGGMAHLVSLWSAPYQWDAWAHLAHSIRTGHPALEAVFGEGTTIWQYLDEHPEQRTIFHQGLTANARLILPALLECYDFSTVSHLVDVGGGHGELAQVLLATYPHLRVTLFDQANVAFPAQAQMQLSVDQTARLTVEAGDFFVHVPEDRECYVLKNVLMDWSDEEAGQILRTCRAAMNAATGRVIVIEPVLSDNASFTPFFSLQMMMMMYAARHRTLKEHQTIARASGLFLKKAIPLGLEQILLEYRASDQIKENSDESTSVA